MPERERVEKFIDLVVSGDYVRAIEDYYHPDASMRENANPPRRGRANLLAHERAVLARSSIKVVSPPTSIIDGDWVAVRWVFGIDDGEATRCLDELALQRWVGDRIFEERFYYDPSVLLHHRPGRM
jgi:hypothetical protein